MGGRISTPLPEADPIPVDDGLSTHQESVPVPLWWGQQKVPLRWITETIDPMAVEATDRPSKK